VVGESRLAPWTRASEPSPDGLQVERVSIPTATGLDVDGWALAGRPGAGSVVLVHAYRSSRLAMRGRARFLHEAGYSVLLIDLPGHGSSPGGPVTFGARESLAVRSAVASAKRRSRGGAVAALGVSMGGAALVLAEPPLPLAAVILESVYPTLDEAVENRLALRIGAPARWLTPLLLSVIGWRSGVAVSGLRPIDHIAGIGAPVFLISGDEDAHTEIEETERLFAAASPPKELWIVAGADHVDLHRFAPREYEARVLAFLAAAFASAGGDQNSSGSTSSSR
jgi:fermentation-respiration switch protein FrsA (DUF1100 family)